LTDGGRARADAKAGGSLRNPGIVRHFWSVERLSRASSLSASTSIRRAAVTDSYQ
jgi:hypothetical protein